MNRFFRAVLTVALFALGVSYGHAQDCHLSDDGSACVPLACSDVPEAQCLPSFIHLDVADGALTVDGCQCRNFNECHIRFGDASPFAEGYCPDGTPCHVVSEDTDGDGIDDLFSASCEPQACCDPLLEPGRDNTPPCVEGHACCADGTWQCNNGDGTPACDPGRVCAACCFWAPTDPGLPIGLTCNNLSGSMCEQIGGRFLAGEQCGEAQACCLATALGIGPACVDVSPACCRYAGGHAGGPRTSCRSAADPNGFACPAPCYRDADCPADSQFCRFPPGSCGSSTSSAGMCVDRRHDCPDVGDPVCGCDGVTYPNECEADAAGVSLRHRGPCESPGVCCLDVDDGPVPFDTCEPLDSAACADRGGVFANADVGCEQHEACCLSSIGVDLCVEMNPVCCRASGGMPGGPNSACHGIDLPEVCGGINGIACPKGYDCVDDPNDNCTGGPVTNCPGMCVPRRMECSGIQGLACPPGFDCRDIPNDNCDPSNGADCPSVCVPSPPPCAEICGGVEGIPCSDPAAFCKLPAGLCCCDHYGVCVVPPPACPTVYDPVCGCDEVTYGNACEADAAGVSIRHPGACEIQCVTDADCPDASQFCLRHPGQCDPTTADGVGVCATPPPVCPDVFDPVCACDGTTYPNECFARMAGQSIEYPGECQTTPCAATRILSNDGTHATYCPGVRLRVVIAIVPPAGTSSFALEDAPPPGWSVVEISNDGTYDAIHHKVKWGPFFGPFPARVAYVALPGDAASAVTCFDGEISIDGANERICGEQCAAYQCAPRMQADVPRGPCPGCQASDCEACGGGCSDGVISLCEMVGYACAWKNGCHDDLSGVSRAAYIWQNGECTCWDASTQNWELSDCPPPASGLCDAPTTGGGATDWASNMAVAPSLTGETSSRNGKFGPRVLSLDLTPPEASSAVAVEVQIPAGWSVTRVSDAGAWDQAHGKIKWGPFTDSLTKTLTATLDRNVEPGSGLRTFAGRRPSPASLRGTVSVDGVNKSIRVPIR